MVLASQMTRSDVSGSGGGRSGGSAKTWMWIAIVGVVVAAGTGLGWGYSKGWIGGPSSATAQVTADDQPLPIVDPSLAVSKPAAISAAATPAPTTLVMGAPKPAAVTTLAQASTPAPGAPLPGATPSKPGTSATPATGATRPGGPAATSPAATQPATPRVAVNDFSEPLSQGLKLIESGQLVAGRARLTTLLFSAEDELKPAEAQTIRDTLNSVNKELFFSPKVVPGDPLAETYEIQQGDFLSKLAPRYRVTHQLIEEINQIDSRRLFVGRKIKMVRGPLHAVVRKKKFMMDVYGNTTSGEPVLVRSFQAGLGEANSTPVGSFIVKNKVPNPGWANPRTGEAFKPDDPKNPIGEYWLGLEGADEASKKFTSYGIHGTIEPDSVGRQMSMGCVRLRDTDIALVYKLLTERGSTVLIRD